MNFDMWPVFALYCQSEVSDKQADMSVGSLCVLSLLNWIFLILLLKKKINKTCCQTYEIAIWVIQTIDIDDD